MKFTNIICSNYEKAFKKAVNLYGPSLRIALRREYEEGILIKKNYCELVCYNQKDCPKTRKEIERIDFEGFEDSFDPNKDEISIKDEIDYSKKYSDYFYEDDIQKIQLKSNLKVSNKEKTIINEKIKEKLKISERFLVKNSFYSVYSASLQKYLKTWLEKQLPELPSNSEYEKHFLEKISSSFECDHTTQVFPPKNFFLTGKAKSGKSQTSLKVAYLFAKLKKEKVANIELKYMKEEKKEKPTPLILGEDYKDCEVITNTQYIDNNFENNYKLNVFDCYSAKNQIEKLALATFINKFDKNDSKRFLVVNINISEKLALDLLKEIAIPFDGIIFTKIDKMAIYGPLISLCSLIKLPVLFITDGLKIPENIHFASNFYIMSQLIGKKFN